MSRRHREALAHLLYGVQGGGGFILLTGEVGTGKTTLCRCLLEQIPTGVETAFVLNPRVSATELLATVCDEFEISYSFDASLKQLTDRLNLYLLDQHAAGKRAVLIIDEAQNLTQDVLEQLRLLTNLETNERKLLQIILLGQPELLDTLAEQNLRQFSQRVTARYHLEALDSLETHDYINHRMGIAGGDARIFTRGAMKKIFRLSQGIPRVINLICDRALLGAYTEESQNVTARIISKAAAEVLGPARNNSAQWRPIAATAVMLVILGLGYSMIEPDLYPAPVKLNTGEASMARADNMLPGRNPTPVPEKTNHLVLSGHDTIDSAYHDLLALWGTAFEDKNLQACELVMDIGLMCLQKQVAISELLEINRPVVVYLDRQYLTLSEIRDGRVTLFAGSRQFELSQSDFSERFDGNINLIWRMPPNYKAPLKVQDSGAAVDWLVMQMAVIEGNVPPLKTGFTYNESLEARVREFQASVGLNPSGVVDPMTWIHINSVEAISIPTLHPDHRG